MDLKKDWPKIALGVTAVALGVYAYTQLRKKEGANVRDIEAALSAIDGKTWPAIRRVVDFSASVKEQQA